MSTDKFEERRARNEASREHRERAVAFKGYIETQPDVPIWLLASQLQEILADSAYAEYHPLYTVGVGEHKSPDGDSVAVIWSSKVRDSIGEPFLSIQATRREVPRLIEPIPLDALDELLAMILDINSYDKSPVAVLVSNGILSFKTTNLSAMDGDPDTNCYAVQGYTNDRKWLIDIQIDYAVIFDDYSKDKA